MIGGRYELKEELGRGAHGRIYSGRDKITRHSIAVKLVFKLFCPNLLITFHVDGKNSKEQEQVLKRGVADEGHDEGESSWLSKTSISQL